MSFMVHLPHYAQLEEDHAGAGRMLEVLSAYFDFTAGAAPSRRGKRQYAEIDAAVDRQPELKIVVSELETYYDARYLGSIEAPSEETRESEQPPSLSPEIERFLQDLDPGR
ncbi:MAG: hypothetical protein IT307_20825 [Chloroflexi bacterium]|nr:hypothetical protein [Chloroflexota bacterium]